MIPKLFRGLFDDAAVFPPVGAPLDVAVQQHLSYRDSEFADLVGPFLFPVTRLDELTDVSATLRISLTAPDGPDTAELAIERLQRRSNFDVAAIEVALPQGTDISALGTVDPAVDIYVEIPPGERRAEVFDAVDERGYRAKFRTGGVTAGEFPSEQELADAIYEATRREIEFKATTGLHHAVRNTDANNGFEQHGYLNILLAAQAAQSGARAADLATILALRNPEVVSRLVAAIETERALLSFETSDVREPLEELTALGLLPPM